MVHWLFFLKCLAKRFVRLLFGFTCSFFFMISVYSDVNFFKLFLYVSAYFYLPIGGELQHIDDIIYIYIYIYIYILYYILCFVFYCKLCKATPDYISELINLNYALDIPFKFSLKTIIMGSWYCWWFRFKKSFFWGPGTSS